MLLKKNMAAFEEQQESICEQVNENLNVGEASIVDSGGMLDELLVEEVRNHRILWDTSARGYKDTIKKNLVWVDISSRLSQNSMYIFISFVLIFYIKSVSIKLLVCSS